MFLLSFTNPKCKDGGKTDLKTITAKQTTLYSNQ